MKLAIIIPYRDRAENLAQFIPHMAEFIKDIDYKIYVIEQADEKPFNRGKLLNIGFKHAVMEDGYDYAIFHDVDMLPVTSDYSYEPIPTHLVGFATQFMGPIPYREYFGGVTLFDKESFIQINGYHNEYWGWGGEDDDVFQRCLAEGITAQRKEGVYNSLPHAGNGANHPNHSQNEAMVHKMRNKEIDYKNEGLNTVNYELIGQEDIDPKVIKISVKL